MQRHEPHAALATPTYLPIRSVNQTRIRWQLLFTHTASREEYGLLHAFPYAHVFRLIDVEQFTYKHRRHDFSREQLLFFLT